MSPYLVVGAGPVGSSVATLLAQRGDAVRLVSRSASGPDLPGVERISADAHDPARIASLAQGCAVVVNAVNPPYHRWPLEWPPIAASLLAAAQDAGAALITVGNLYPYGPLDVPMVEGLPDVATTPKAAVRGRMWADALAAHQAGRVRAAEVRGSDYVGGPGVQSHLGDRVVPKILAGKSVQVLGATDVPHSWTYVEDMARTVVAVADDADAMGRVWHVPSNPPKTQREAVADLCAAAGVAPVGVSTVPGLALRALGLVNPMVRELKEVIYQLQQPYILDSSAAQAQFGLAPTPWSDICDAVIEGYRRAA